MECSSKLVSWPQPMVSLYMKGTWGKQVKSILMKTKKSHFKPKHCNYFHMDVYPYENNYNAIYNTKASDLNVFLFFYNYDICKTYIIYTIT